MRKKKIISIIMIMSLILSFVISVYAEENNNSFQSENDTFTYKKTDRSIDFNDGWKFIQSDVNGAENKDYNDSSWTKLNLPHDWSISLDFNRNSKAGQTAGFLDGGTGWYRKTFKLTDDMKNKHISVDFDGVMSVATVYINGNEVEHNYYGYTAFNVDITDYVNEGENVIAVKVVNRQPSSRWYSGSGIYRNVKLTVTDMIYVDTNGTYITTPTLENDLKENKAQVNIKTNIVNNSGAEKNITLNTKILDESGNVVSEKTDTSYEQTITVDNPILWSVDNPYLYTAESNVIVDGEIVDTYNTTFGIRYITFDSNEGFSLNGEYMKLKGVCLHHDLGALGAAENKRAIERQLDMMKAMGVNAIRSSHNPASKTMVELCNEKGIMLLEEAFDMWSMRKTSYDYAGAGYFKLYAEDDVKKMVERDKNDPCVIMWSIGNEITWAEDNLESAEKLINAIKSVDTTRPVTMNENHYATGQGQQLMDMVDVAGYSYAPDSQYIKDHENHPDWILFGSEIGSHMESRGVYYDPKQKKQVDYDELQCSAYDIQQPDVRWGKTVAEGWKFDRDNKFVLGEFVWTGFDYIGEPTPYMNYSITDIDGNVIIPKSSYFGIVDTAGIPKDSYYLYQSQWTDTPMVHILPHWNWDNGEKVQVWAYTNADSVELFLNGKSLGVKSFEKKTTDYGMEYKETSDGEIYLSWEVPYEAGELKAVATLDGKIVAEDTVKTAGSAQSVKLTPDRRVIDGDGNDLSFVTVDITDNQGVVVPDADNLVNFDVENGEIMGVDNGNADEEQYSKYGKFTVSGTVEGTDIKPKAEIEVVGVIAVENISVGTIIYEKPELPETVTVYYSNGTQDEKKVEWEEISEDMYSKTGEFSLKGDVDGVNIKANASVRVTDEYIRGLDLSARKNGYHYPEITASNTYSDDDIENAIDEVISYTNSPKNRWSDYKDTSENVWIEFVLGYEEETEFYIDDVTIHYFKDKYGSGAPNTMQIQYWDSTDEEWIDVNNQSETSENVDGDSNTSGIVTTYEFDKVKTSRLRFNMTKDSDKCVAITEIKFYSDYMEKYDTDVLDDIQINGESLSTFDSNNLKYDYEYDGSNIPNITATAHDNAAVTVIPATYDNLIAKIIVVSESGTSRRTYTVRLNKAGEELQGIESLDSNLEFYLVNNESSVNAPKFKIVNNSDEVQTVKLYVAGYSDGVLKKINFTDVSIVQGDIQYLSTEIDKDDTVSDYKYFIWDNNNTPKTNCISING